MKLIKHLFSYLVALIMITACSETGSNDNIKGDYPKLKIESSLDNILNKKEVKTFFKVKKSEFPGKIKSKKDRLIIKLKGKGTLFSKKYFSLTPVNESNNTLIDKEIQIQQEFKQNNLIGISCFLTNVKFQDLSALYLFKEQTDKRIIEGNKRREGHIFSIKENQIKIEYNASKISDKEVSNFLTQRFKEWNSGKSLFFDINNTGKFLALLDFHKVDKDLGHKNFKFYLNPVTNLVEPILSSLNGIENNIGVKSSDNLINSILNNKSLKHSYSFHLDELTKNKVSILNRVSNLDSSIISENHPELNYDKENKIVKLVDSSITVDRLITIDDGYTFVIDAGTTLNLIKEGGLISYSKIKINGTAAKPVTINSTDSSSCGFHVINAADTSFVEYCTFNNLKTINNKFWKLPSSVTFYESNVIINNSNFSNNNSEDALNIFRSSYVVNNITIDNTFSDSFDGDFSNGILRNCKFTNSGNDGIDVSGSVLKVINCSFTNIADKALSAGEDSHMEIDSIQVNGASLGITSKDLSSVKISNSNLSNCEVVYCAFQKKGEFGPSSIEAHNVTISKFKEENLIEENSTLTIDGEKIHNYRDDVRKYLYGNEYGKKTVK